jgi:hypothetical protein
MNEARCRGEEVNITYSECVSECALGTQHAKLMLHIIICGLSVSTVFSTLSPNGTI